MLEYLVRCAPELAAIMTATTGIGFRPVFLQASVTCPTPKNGSMSGLPPPPWPAPRRP